MISPDSSPSDPAERLWLLWEEGREPNLGDFLAGLGPLAPADLLAVVRIDQRQRWLLGRPVSARKYLKTYPALRADPEHALELVYSEYLLREEVDQAPALDEYVRRYPELAERLRQQIQLHQALEAGATELLGVNAPTPDGAFFTPRAIEGEDEALPQLPNYEIRKILGRGGMGVVYQAEQVLARRLVAVKMMRRGDAASDEERRRFRAEAEAMARLAHPNLIQVHDVGESEGRPYFAMEYADGGSLAQRLGGRPLRPRQAAGVAQTLAKALHYAHGCGVVHRDLKPANVLLTAKGVPKITDFGLAKKLGGSIHTRTGVIVGTPAYMAPEQAVGQSKAVGPAADVYSLGALLYEMLTGRPPFQADTVLHLLIQVRTQDPTPPRLIQPHAPLDLETICLKCLQKDPARRYASAAALADDLKRYLNGEPVQARPTSHSERLWKWARREPGAAALTAGLLLVFLLGFGLVTWQWLRAEGEAARAWRAEAAAEKQARSEAAARRREDLALWDSRASAAGVALDKALNLCDEGDVGRGLLWLTRARQLAPADADDLHRAVAVNLTAWTPRVRSLRLCLEHGAPLHAVAWSPDGALIATGGEDGKVRLWDAGGQPHGEPLLHKGAVTSLVFRADGALLLTGARAPARKPGEPPPRGEACLWNVRSGTRVAVMEHPADILSVAFLRDGRVLTGCRDAQARIWKDGVAQLFAHGQPVRTVAVNASGSRFVTVGGDVVQIWDLATGKPIGRKLDDSLLAAAYSPDAKADGTFLVGARRRGREGGSAQLRGAGGDAIGALRCADSVEAVAFHPDGKSLLTGGADGLATFWDLQGRRSGPPLPHPAAVRGVAYRPDARAVLTACADGAARVWEVVADRPLERPQLPPFVHNGSVCATAFAAEGKLLYTAGRLAEEKAWGVLAWNLAEPAASPRVLLRLEQPIGAAVFSGDGKTALLAVGGKDQALTLADLEQKRVLRTFAPPHKGAIYVVARSADGCRACTGGKDGVARLWDLEAGTNRELPHDQQEVRAAAFSPDGHILATGAADGEVRLWDPETATERLPPLPHRGMVEALAFSPDGRWLLSAGADAAARQWDPQTGQPRGPPLAHGGGVRALAYSDDGALIAAGVYDEVRGVRFARLWDAASCQPLGPPLPHDRLVLAVAFAADRQSFVTATAGDDERRTPSGAARIWTVPSPTPGSTERLVLWAQLLAGQELDATGATRPLRAAEWQRRRGQLEALGGAPVP